MKTRCGGSQGGGVVVREMHARHRRSVSAGRGRERRRSSTLPTAHTTREPRAPQVNYMASFNTEAFPDSIAIAKVGSMTIGTIDEIQAS